MNKDIRPFNDKGEPHGLWEIYWGNCDLQYQCVYHNGKEIGYEEFYNFYHNKLIKKRYNI